MILHNVVLAEAYLRTKWHLDPCSHLATIDMGQKLGASPPFRDGAGSLSNTKLPGLRPTYTKWHFDTSSRLATIEMGRK